MLLLTSEADLVVSEHAPLLGLLAGQPGARRGSPQALGPGGQLVRLAVEGHAHDHFALGEAHLGVGLHRSVLIETEPGNGKCWLRGA